MPYIGEVLVVQQYIRDMTGHDIRKEVVLTALERAEKYRLENSAREKGDL